MRGKPFQPGQSGNPGGRPRVLADVRKLAQTHSASAIATLAGLTKNTKFSPVARIAAANSLLDRAVGKPPMDTFVNGFRLPELKSAADAGEAMRAIAEAVSDSVIGASEGVE